MNNGTWIVENENVDYLNNLFLDENLTIRPVESKILHEIPIKHLQIWAHHNAIYQIITTELLEFLRNEIAGLKTIEICAGAGIISRELGIIGTDSFMQKSKLFKAHAASLGQEITKPGKHVKKYEALDAIRMFKPECVIGTFASQKTTYGEYVQKIQGSPYGVDEIELLGRVLKYINIGNKDTHFGKHIFKCPHREEYYPWLVSRAFDQSKNRIWIWG